jgi:hypothetical protein
VTFIEPKNAIFWDVTPCGSCNSHKFINSIWNKEELPDQSKKSNIVPVPKMGDKTDCNNYRGISLLSNSYKILSNILPSRLSQYIDEIFAENQ